jgi:hypothetical protein
MAESGSEESAEARWNARIAAALPAPEEDDGDPLEVFAAPNCPACLEPLALTDEGGWACSTCPS